MAVAPDLGQRAGLADEGVVLGHAAVLAHADHLAVVVVQRLRVVAAREAVAQRHEQRAIRLAIHPPLDDAAAEVQAAAVLGLLAEDHLDVGQPLAVVRQARPRQRRAVAGALARLAEAEVDGAVAGEVRIGDHVQQAALPAGHHLGQALQRRLQLAVGLHHAHAAGALGHQKAPLGQKGHRPRVLQAAGHGLRLGCLRHGRPPHAAQGQPGYYQFNSCLRMSVMA